MADYIDRQVAIDIVAFECGKWTGLAKEISKQLKRLTADVVPVVHAHWIQTSAEDENGNAYYYCSNCGRGESHNPIVEVPYCWKCGAKMDEHGES